MTYEEKLMREQKNNNPLYLIGEDGGKLVLLTPTDCYCRFFIRLYKTFPKGFIEFSVLIDELTCIHAIVKKVILDKLKRSGFECEWLIVSSMKKPAIAEAIEPFVTFLVQALGGEFDKVAYDNGFNLYLDLLKQC